MNKMRIFSSEVQPCPEGRIHGPGFLGSFEVENSRFTAAANDDIGLDIVVDAQAVCPEFFVTERAGGDFGSAKPKSAPSLVKALSEVKGYNVVVRNRFIEHKAFD